MFLKFFGMARFCSGRGVFRRGGFGGFFDGEAGLARGMGCLGNARSASDISQYRSIRVLPVNPVTLAALVLQQDAH